MEGSYSLIEFCDLVKEFYKTKQPIKPNKKMPHLFGRVGSTMHVNDVMEKFSLAPNRKVVFVFGPELIEQLLHTDPYHLLLKLGFQPEHIYRDLILSKESQKVILFDPTTSNICVTSADWNGVEEYLRNIYPEAYEDYLHHKHDIRNKTVAQFESEANIKYKFYNCIEKGSTTYMTYEKYKQIQKPRLAWQLRLFMYCELRLLELYNGDGLTKTIHGTQGTLEYLCSNATLKDIKDCVVLDLPVVIPEDVLDYCKLKYYVVH
eukprot:TRINITY_DN8741_c0_g1_i1.p1 TRINITY_DN8741_c0_g1~~TRINITY_DN8741_c0_g1_i1.p1  ORF type:complete len:262 (+),score=36.26 TRINITY_DN8741_c0_g1_i1:3-788(+)